MSNITFILILFTQVLFPRLPKSKNAHNLIYFYTVYKGVFFSYSYRTLYFARFFATAIL